MDDLVTKTSRREIWVIYGGRERETTRRVAAGRKELSRAPTRNRETTALRQPVFFRGGLNSCSVRVFINTGSRADLSSRALVSLAGPRNGDEGHVLQATKEKVSQFPLLSIVSDLRPSLILPFLPPFSYSFCRWLFSFIQCNINIYFLY